MATHQQWKLDDRKFLTFHEVRRLRLRAVQSAVLLDAVAVRGWMLVDLGLQTGLRVAELANLRVADVLLVDGCQSIFVRRGKGGKKRTVAIGEDLARHVEEYLGWKERVGEPLHRTAPLFWSDRSRGRFSRRYLQKLFKELAAGAELRPELSIHCLRHTYASNLYKASGYNLRLVQKQLGHSSIQVTQVYADVFEDDVREAVRQLYPPAPVVPESPEVPRSLS